MALQDQTKISLAAQYDDLCRYNRVLTMGCEKEFIDFSEIQLNLKRKLKQTEDKIQELKKRNTALEIEKRKHEYQINNSKNLLELEVKKRRKIETEKAFLEEKMLLIREAVLIDRDKFDSQTKDKLFHLSNSDSEKQMGLEAKLPITDDTIGSLLSSSDIDDTFHQQKQLFEESSEESDYPNQMRRKLEENLVSDVEETESIVQKRIQDISEIRDSKAPCNSESTSSSLPQLPNIILESDSELIKSCGYSLQSSKAKTNISSTPKDRCNSDGKIHSFVSRPAMHPEKCYFCCKTITFCKQVSKCSSCKMTCHPCCKERCPLPCIPIILPRRNFVGTITDYTSSTSPKIPSIIICCINEIESRGLKCIGLYRKSGYGRDVKILKENLLKGKIPDNLGKIDIHTICSALKEFLRSLKEPLITRSAWKILVDAANQSNENVSLKLLYDALCDLPQSNKETLAFLLLHLQKVAESTECKMPHENLAKVFGPTIIGYSTDNPPNSSMLFETGQQCLVMRKLLKIAADLWQNFLKDEKIEFLDSSQEKKPDKVKALAVSRFEPIYASVQKRKKSLTKKSHSPRIQRFS